jgi:hypothetical protein
MGTPRSLEIGITGSGPQLELRDAPALGVRAPCCSISTRVPVGTLAGAPVAGVLAREPK